MGKKKESTIVIQQSPSGSYSEKDFELRMQKRDLRKMRRRVNRTFARFNNIIMSIENNKEKIYGTQFHPEGLESTKKVIDNFIKICKIST